MKVLIIGGAGFIGSKIAETLAARDKYNITIADNLFRGKLDNFLQKIIDEENIKFINADFTDPKSFDLFDKNYDHVYLLASVVGVKYTEEIPDELIRINTSLILNTLEWLKQSQCKKALFSSTSECYAGTIDSFDFAIPTPEDIPLCIADIHNPRFTYAVTKLLGESGFYHYGKVHGFETTTIRYHNVYGPRMGFKHVIPQVIQRFLKGEQDFEIFGFNQTRSFNYIDDAVKGTILAMESSKTDGEIIHIGDSNDEILIEDLVKYIGKKMNYKGEYRLVSAPKGSVSRRCPDISKAKKLTGYKPEINWREGVKRTMDWYINYIQSGGDIFE